MLIRKGAEASIFLEEWHGRRVVMKTRFPKLYRVAPLDNSIRVARTSREAHLIHDSKLAGVPTPTLYQIDGSTCTIVMEYIDGPRLKETLPHLNRSKLELVGEDIGTLIGRLHSNKIVHGDLTTSNMILKDRAKLFFIDFGLGDYSNELEPRGIDLLLMSRAFKSTHYALFSRAFKAVMKGYQEIVGDDEAELVSGKMHEIGKRGRYSERTQSNLLSNRKQGQIQRSRLSSCTLQRETTDAARDKNRDPV